MAEAYYFLAAAWAAGVLEGASVLRRKAPCDSSSSSEALALFKIVPSAMLYGTLAVPLGVIGASPGLLPFTSTLDRNDSNHTTMSEMTIHSGLHESSSIDDPAATSHTSTNDTKRSEMIRRAREENRRTLAQIRPPSSQPPPTTRQPRSYWNTLATLDGRPLPTALAEGMRRARCLLVGAGLVAAVLHYQEQRTRIDKEKEETMRQEESLLRRHGRSVEAIESMVESSCRRTQDHTTESSSSHSNGVVVRLIGSRNDVDQPFLFSRGNYNVVPVICASFVQPKTNPMIRYESPPEDVVSPFWDLGVENRHRAWMDMPLTKDWLLNESTLVVEADVSLPLSMGYFATLSTPLQESALNQERVVLGANTVALLARRNGVARNDTSKNEKEIVTVLVGSEERGTAGGRLKAAGHVVHLHGPTAVAVEVLSRLEAIKMHDEADAKDKSQQTRIMQLEEKLNDADRDAKSALGVMSFVEAIGSKIRQGGEATISVTWKVVSAMKRRPQRKVINLLTDQSEPASFFSNALGAHDWVVHPHDVSNRAGANEKLESIIGRGGISLLCCGSDEKTLALLTSLLRKSGTGQTGDVGPGGRVLVLVEREASAVLLRDLVGLSASSNIDLSVMSIEGVHSSLFANAHDLLSSGNTPSQVQDLLSLIQ